MESVEWYDACRAGDHVEFHRWRGCDNLMACMPAGISRMVLFGRTVNFDFSDRDKAVDRVSENRNEELETSRHEFDKVCKRSEL